MNLTTQDIKHIAKLSRLELQDNEAEKYRGNLVSILGYVEKMGEVNTDGVPEMTTGAVSNNVWRSDESRVSDLNERDAVVNSFPRRQGTLLEVPAVFEGRTE